MFKKGPPPIPLSIRFWSKVDRRGPNECWPWKASGVPAGYGSLWVNEKRAKEYSHRIAWILVHGEIPEGYFVCHRCDNPPCCNPYSHLFLALPAENSADMSAKGRSRRGADSPAAKLSDADVSLVFSLAGTLTQEEIAARVGVRQPAISRILAKKRWAHFQGVEA
jgi:hypothetical protein